MNSIFGVFENVFKYVKLLTDWASEYLTEEFKNTKKYKAMKNLAIESIKKSGK